MAVILYSPPSPYSAKARMVALAAGLGIEARPVSTEPPDEALLAANPLGKIPVLITDQGEAVYDSRAITHYLDRLSGGAVLPRKAERRLEAERLEALADGICDCLLAITYERRFRPEDKHHQPWMDRQWRKVERALDHLADGNLPRMTKRPQAGQIALRATLGYLSLRFGGRWERGRSKLVRWAARFDAQHPHLAAALPSA